MKPDGFWIILELTAICSSTGELVKTVEITWRIAKPAGFFSRYTRRIFGAYSSNSNEWKLSQVHKKLWSPKTKFKWKILYKPGSSTGLGGRQIVLALLKADCGIGSFKVAMAASKYACG